MRIFVAVTALLFAAAFSAPASAELVVFACEHQSGAFRGQIWTVDVDFAARRVRMIDDAAVAAEISDRYITFRRPRAAGAELMRIDLATGQMTYWRQTGWDTVFGSPGIICRRAGNILRP